MTFFLDTSANVVKGYPEDVEAYSGAMEAPWSCGGPP
jgi:hypothetical protein